MEGLSVARTCVGGSSLSHTNRTVRHSSTGPVITRNSSSFLGFTFMPRGLSLLSTSNRQEGRLERRAPSALLNADEYRKQQLEKAFVKEMGSDTFENDNDEDLCPIECVREINKLSELEHVIKDAKSVGALVVVDFFRTSCGSCRYIEKDSRSFAKELAMVMDEYDEQSDIAEKFRIKVVPLFHFYKNGELVESFPTRDKTRILEAIYKHLDVDQTIEEWSDLHGLK